MLSSAGCSSRVDRRRPTRLAAKRGAEPGQSLPPAWGGVLPVHCYAGDRTDQQPGRAGDPFRGAGPAGDPEDAERAGAALVRTDMDGHRDMCPARAIRVPRPPSRPLRPGARRACSLTSARRAVNGYGNSFTASTARNPTAAFKTLPATALPPSGSPPALDACKVRADIIGYGSHLWVGPVSKGDRAMKRGFLPERVYPCVYFHFAVSVARECRPPLALSPSSFWSLARCLVSLPR